MLIKKLTKHGNSLALVIDKPILELLNIEPGTSLELSIADGSLTVRPVRSEDRQERLAEASNRIHARYGKVFKKLAE